MYVKWIKFFLFFMYFLIMCGVYYSLYRIYIYGILIGGL